jgi:hypothetical protein
MLRVYRENIQQTHYSRQLYLEQHTQYGKYCSVTLEVWAVGVTASSREVPGRKPVTRDNNDDDDDDDDDNINNNTQAHARHIWQTRC